MKVRGLQVTHRLLRATAVVVVAIGLGAGAAGCAAGHTTLGTSTGTCFLALPTASATVGGAGKMVGVKSFNPHALIAELEKRARKIGPGVNPYMPFGDSTTTSADSPLVTSLTGRQARVRRAVREIARHLAVFGNRQVCAVEYEGNFHPGSVAHAVDGKGSGRYAIVVLPAKGGQPIVSLVLKRLPFTLRHFF